MAQDTIINTFNGGLNQDVDYILQPDGTYRNMKNGMLVSMDGHHFTVELAKGNVKITDIKPRYTVDKTTYDVYPMPIGFVSFIDDLVVFSTNDTTDGGGYGEIGVIRFTRVQDQYLATYTPYYHHPNLNFSKAHAIEGFSYRENDTTERVYWTDNNNEPRVFDIGDPMFTTYKTPTAGVGDNPLEVGKQYMVLKGVINNGGADDYGPCDGSGTNFTTNIFTATANTYTEVTGANTTLVIEYYPIELLDWTPSRSMGDITFSEYASGSKNYGANIYFYRLYSSDGNVQTTWSYPSSPIHVGGDNVSTYLTGTPYHDFVGNGSETTIVSSNKSVKVRIQNIDTNFDVIELCCAEFTQTKDVPYSIKIVAKENITSTEMVIEDKGSSNYGSVSISDLTLFPANILKVKTLATNKNYNLIGNLTERAEFDLDLSGVTIGQVNYPMVCHDDYKNAASCANGMIPVDVSPTIGANPGVGDIYADSRWIVKLGNLTTDTVEYPSGSGTFYVTGDIITGIPYSAAVGDESTIAFTGTASVAPCTTRNRYNVISSGARVEDYIEFTSQSTAFWDYKNPAVASHNKGYWSKEKYRFGILFYDLKGNPFYVKYIKGDPTTFDYTFDDVVTKGGLVIERDYSATLKSYSLNVSGATISGLDIPESVINKCSGFSIVRAERDPIIIAQGLMMQTQSDQIYGGTSLAPLGAVPTSFSSWRPYYDARGTLCSFICPDHLVNYTFNNPIGVIGQTISEAFWLDGSHIKSYGTHNALVSKLLTLPTPYNSTGSPRVKKLVSMNGYGNRSFNEYNGDNNILGNGLNYYNRFQTLSSTALNTFADNNCVGTFFTPGIEVYSTGSKKMVIFPERFNHYGGAGDYNGSSAPELAIWQKIVMNILTETSPASQYGGSSASAIANTTYISTGHFQPFTAQVKADTDNGFFAGGIYDKEKKYTFNNIEIFGGDCFTNLVDVAYGLYDADFSVPGTDSMGYQIWFPCEGNTNWGLNRGLKGSNKGVYPFSTPPTGVVWYDPGMTPNTQVESFNYNKGYSSDGTFIKYPALPNNYKFTGKFEYRTRFAGVKYPGEAVDSFRKFLTADYKDLDGQAGEINNIRSKEGRVIVWQNKGVSSVPILERLLLGATSGAATTIGTGGVVDRFDPISSFYGNQHQRGLVETEYGYMWFDMRTRSMCIMGSGGGIQEISLTKGLQSFFNNQFNEGDITALTASQIYNTNNSDTFKELPLMGYGIVGVYDPRYKMSYLTFKYIKDAIVDLEDELVTLEAKDFTVGYSHVLNVIVGFYDFTPGIYHNHNDLVLSANNYKNYVYYGPGMPPTTFNVGDVVRVNDTVANGSHGEYVCIKTVTMAGYPTSSVFNPAYPGSLYWTKINNESEIYLQTFNAEYCKFYGKVYDHELEIIVNPRTEGAVSFLNVQMKGSDLNYTSVYCDTDDQSSSDISISSTNRNYRYVNKSWLFSLPLSSKGRLKDHYVKVKYVLKNYVTNPTTAINTNKIVQFIKTWFVTKN